MPTRHLNVFLMQCIVPTAEDDGDRVLAKHLLNLLLLETLMCCAPPISNSCAALFFLEYVGTQDKGLFSGIN